MPIGTGTDRFVLTRQRCLRAAPPGAPCQSLLWFDAKLGLWRCTSCGHERQAVPQELRFFHGKTPRPFSLTELLADEHACLALAEDLMAHGESFETIEAVLKAMKVSGKTPSRILAELKAREH